MSFKVDPAQNESSGILYARNVSDENLEYIKKEAEKLGYTHVGFYLNAVFNKIRGLNNAEGVKVRKKTGRRNKKTG